MFNDDICYSVKYNFNVSGVSRTGKVGVDLGQAAHRWLVQLQELLQDELASLLICVGTYAAASKWAWLSYHMILPV